LLAWRCRQYLIFVGYSEAEILRLGDLAKLTHERTNELMHSNNLETTKETGEELNKTAPHIPAFSDKTVTPSHSNLSLKARSGVNPLIASSQNC
jgi:hypothetical protein